MRSRWTALIVRLLVDIWPRYSWSLMVAPRLAPTADHRSAGELLSTADPTLCRRPAILSGQRGQRLCHRHLHGEEGDDHVGCPSAAATGCPAARRGRSHQCRRGGADPQAKQRRLGRQVQWPSTPLRQSTPTAPRELASQCRCWPVSASPLSVPGSRRPEPEPRNRLVLLPAAGAGVPPNWCAGEQ